jgi:glycerophosphoryl diester phosphodiesterase
VLFSANFALFIFIDIPALLCYNEEKKEVFLMNTIKFDNKGNIKMVAHRGVSGLERENTCPAFVAAGVKSYYGIETDVHVTLDGKYIIIHDDDLKRVAGLDMGVETSNFDDLRAIRMTDRDGITARADIFLPTLEEYLSICKKYDKVAVLELKRDMEREHVEGIAAAVDARGMLENTTFISFSKQNLLYLRDAYPSANAQFLTGALDETNIAFMLDNNLDADIFYKSMTKEFVDLMHANNRVVNVWTVDTLDAAEQMLELGVDMITSNILE